MKKMIRAALLFAALGIPGAVYGRGVDPQFIGADATKVETVMNRIFNNLVGCVWSGKENNEYWVRPRAIFAAKIVETMDGTRYMKLNITQEEEWRDSIRGAIEVFEREGRKKALAKVKSAAEFEDKFTIFIEKHGSEQFKGKFSEKIDHCPQVQIDLTNGKLTRGNCYNTYYYQLERDLSEPSCGLLNIDK